MFSRKLNIKYALLCVSLYVFVCVCPCVCVFQLFYMLKGDMVLKVVERGKHRDVPIKEGEVSVFVLLN